MERRRQKDVDDVIIKVLLSRPQDAGNLKKAVIDETKISERVYHLHLKKLLRLRSIEEIAEKGSSGRIIKRYAIKKEKPSGPKAQYISDAELEGLRDKRLLELAAWIKRNPDPWESDLDDVRKAKLCLEHCTYLVPSIEESYEDPDRYVLVWPQETSRETEFQETVSSRFFNLQDIYKAVFTDSSRVLGLGHTFFGVYNTQIIVGYDPIYGSGMQPPRPVWRPMRHQPIMDFGSVCVAVSKEADDYIRIVHVETRRGKLDDSWVSAISGQLRASKAQVMKCDSLRDDVKRRLLLKLRDMLKRRKLVFPIKYVSLLDDLREYSYAGYSPGYVLALAIAVDLCSG